MSTAPRRPDLANEPVGRLMLRLSIPTITAQLVNMLYNIVDRIYIGHMPQVGSDGGEPCRRELQAVVERIGRVHTRQVGGIGPEQAVDVGLHTVGEVGYGL